MCFCVYAFTQMSELVSQMYFLVCSCCILGDIFKNTGYVILIDLVILFAQVGKSRFEVAPPNWN